MPAEHRLRFYNPEEDKAIQGRVKGYIEGWNARDAEKVSNFFATEADFVTVTGIKACGKESIRALGNVMLSALPENFCMRYRSMDTRFLRRTVAVVEFTWELLLAKEDGEFGKIDPSKIDPTQVPYQEGLALLVMSRAVRKPWLIEVIHHTGILAIDQPKPSVP